jgi:hypothetical protein
MVATTTHPTASQLKLMHSFLARPTASLLVCWTIIALTLGMLWLYARSQNFLNCDMECGETTLAISEAVQFANHGLKFGLLENLGTLEAPMLYTHSVNLGSLTLVLLEALGVHDFSHQALLPLFAYGAGLFYVFLTVRSVTRSNLCALLALLIFATTYWAAGAFAFNVLRAWHIPAFFAVTYHSIHIASGSRLAVHKIGLACGAFIAFGCGYDFWLVCLFVALTILVFFSHKLILRHLFVKGGAIGFFFVLPFLLRQAHIAYVLGAGYWYQDFIFSVAIKVPYATKLISIPPIEEIDAYYRSLGVARPFALPTSSVHDILFTLRHMVSDITLPRWGWLTLLTYLAVLGASLIPQLRSTRIGVFGAALVLPLSIGVALGIALVAPFSLHVYFKHEFPLIGFLLLLAKSIVIYALVTSAIDTGKWRFAAAAAIVLYTADTGLTHWNNTANGLYSNLEWRRFLESRRDVVAAAYVQNLPYREGAPVIGLDERQLSRMPYDRLTGSDATYLIYQPVRRLADFDSPAPVCSWHDWLTHFLGRARAQPGVSCIYGFPVPAGATPDPSLDEFLQSAADFRLVERSDVGIGYVILARDRR